MATQEPSKVIQVLNVDPATSEPDVLQLFLPFGLVNKLEMLHAENQALLQMQDDRLAVAAVQFYATHLPSIRGRRVYVQFSSQQELTTMELSTQGRGDEMDCDQLPGSCISIHWDSENATVIGNIGVYTVAMRIREAVWHSLPRVRMVNFMGFGNKTTFSYKQREGYSKSKVPLFDVPTGEKNAADMGLMLDMFKFAFDNPPPAFIMLISSDSDFYQTLKALKDLGYTTILSHREYKCSLELKLSSDCLCDWDTMCDGRGFRINNSESCLQLKLAPNVCFQISTKTGVFWNLYSSPLSSVYEHVEASLYISTLSEDRKEMEYKAYGNQRYFPKNAKDLAMTYIHTTKKTSQNKLISINNVMVSDIMTFAYKNRPPCDIIIVTGDQDLCPVIQFLRERNYSVTVVIPFEATSLDLPELRDAATRVLQCPNWSKICGQSADISGQSADTSGQSSNSSIQKSSKKKKVVPPRQEWRVKPSQ